MQTMQLASLRLASNCSGHFSPFDHYSRKSFLHLKCDSSGLALGSLPSNPQPYLHFCTTYHRFLDFSFSCIDYSVQPLCFGPSLPFTLRLGGKKSVFGFKQCEAYSRNGNSESFERKTQFVRAFEEDAMILADDIDVRKTLRLVECAMFAASAGLAYFLSTLLRLEAYFGCFFPLPIVMASMRWGAYAGRKTMVATTILLLVLSGPLRAASYLLMHGFVGLAMGVLWRWKVSWGLSIIACTVVRSIGSLGFIGLSSWLLRDNILALITINAHASICYMIAAFGLNVVPTMGMIYVIFATLLLVNCGSFVFLLHVLYAIFLHRLGIKISIAMPTWVERAF
ncbi:hypothetical protein O6H91_11G067200 [Diphasiastrum complanatum]|uniref:Uncharacterized protein n=1 Tax=Diphasiastrum complanatum TaxID=34168 RepID=A0ACC2CA47_DIPCM|nr:hypothetical protein O6H91_11G067200 [Diphasiastrum complanatum]